MSNSPWRRTTRLRLSLAFPHFNWSHGVSVPMLGAKEAAMALEELQLLRLVRAFAKIKDQKRRMEIIQFAETVAEENPEPQLKPAK